MTSTRRILIASVLATAVAAVAASIALGGSSGGPAKPAYVSSHGLRARTVVGTQCFGGTSSDGMGYTACADAAYPLNVHSYLPITAGGKMRANLRKRAKSVSVKLVRVEGDKFDFVGDVGAKPVKGKHRRVWRLKLPGDLAGANVVDINTVWANGHDADFWAGVKPVEQWP